MAWDVDVETDIGRYKKLATNAMGGVKKPALRLIPGLLFLGDDKLFFLRRKLQ